MTNEQTKEQFLLALNSNAYLNMCTCEDMQNAINALDKQIPKKPIVWEERYYYSPTPNDDWGYECPCCGNREIDYPEHHCTCGQALDWKDFD